MVSGYPTEVDTEILIAVNRFAYLTAEQLARLRYPNLADHGRYARRRLRSLAERGYLLRLSAFPAPQFGSAPYVFTLSRTGRTYLSQQGIAVPDYFRPSETRVKAANPIFMAHTLAVIDVLISAERLTQDIPAVTLTRLLTERELKQVPIRVAPDPDTPRRTVAVIPDAWFQLQVSGRRPVAIAVELDRGSEHQRPWRRKVAALIRWATGPYKQAFQAKNVTIAVIAPTPDRVRDLREWTRQQIYESRVHPRLAELFLFTSVDPAEVPAEEFFFLPLWVAAGSDEPVSLLDALPSAAAQLRPCWTTP